MSENDKLAYIMMREIEELGFEHKYKIVEEKFNFFLSQSYYNKDDTYQKQFTLMIEAILLLALYNKAEEALKKTTEAIKITLPDFNTEYLNSHQFNLTEYQIINTIAIIYMNLEKTNEGIDIFKRMKISLCNKPYLKEFKNRLFEHNTGKESHPPVYPYNLFDVSMILKIVQKFQTCYQKW